ncbi:MAG: leucine-rich repeat domain-containing protein [Cytophagales bacterium]|nr:leucine-rich repeat domain-containing protein [Cytophaga sp.]
MIGIFILIPICLLCFALFLKAQNPLKYKYLFRNTILSTSGNYELAAVLRGRVYYPRYFYIPSLKQYMVYSNVDETGPFRIYKMNTKVYGKTYALLNETGHSILTFDTSLHFSYRSGCFYGPGYYIPLLETGKKDTLPYHAIHNEKLDLSEETFEKLFIELYQTAEYIEFINLRASNDDIHQAGVIFKRQGKVEILLSGLRSSRMLCRFQEDRTINNFDDYYLPDISNKEAYPQSEPAIQMVPLQTTNTNPFVYWRTGFKHPFQIKKYHQEYSSGWQGIMKVHGIPIYVPGDGSGIAYVRFKVKDEIFRIKIVEVVKVNLVPAYNLGLRTFEVPSNIRNEESLVFMESSQNMGDNRMGGGVFVVRKTTNTHPSADIPSDITEEHFNTLPINLQEALLNPDSARGIILNDQNITHWIPEIERLKFLTQLEMSTSMSEIPDGISTLSRLQVLSVKYGKIQKISPRLGALTELKELYLFSNKLTEFPDVVLQLKQLKRLDIGANEISSLPDDINTLEQLEYLSLTLTNVTTLPESMIGMTKLYINDSQDLKNKVPPTYRQLFEYDKNGE